MSWMTDNSFGTLEMFEDKDSVSAVDSYTNDVFLDKAYMPHYVQCFNEIKSL
jgi:hypothetical protein